LTRFTASGEFPRHNRGNAADNKPLPPATANKEYSGRFVLRVGRELHREVAINALRSGESLNSYCLKVLKKAVGQG
jgi:predicted HicB family RNase H-like nuclease